MQLGGEPEFCSLGFGNMVLNLFIHHPMVQLGPGSASEFGSPRGAHIPQGNPLSNLCTQYPAAPGAAAGWLLQHHLTPQFGLWAFSSPTHVDLEHGSNAGR